MLLKEISCITDLSRRIARRVELLFIAFIAVSPEATAQDAQCVPERAAMSLARLWRCQGKPQQVHELLAPVYRCFTEGFDTRDQREARVLLDEG
jgi:predicted ATPase